MARVRGFACERFDCFANVGGECKALTGKTAQQPCPFFKTAEQIENENRYAHARLGIKRR